MRSLAISFLRLESGNSSTTLRGSDLTTSLLKKCKDESGRTIISCNSETGTKGQGMSDRKTDHELGMNRGITRRDFMNGVASAARGTLGGGGGGTETLAAAAAWDEFHQEKRWGHVPT